MPARAYCAGSFPQRSTAGGAVAPNPSTGATAGTPGTFTPAGSTIPYLFAGMTGIVATPNTAWTPGQYVVTGNGSNCYWSGTAWVAGIAAAPRPTGATAGAPGTFTPGGSSVPANLADLQGAPPIVPSPSSAWTVGQYVLLGDASHAYWTGSGYVAGDAPAPPATGATAGFPGSFTPAGCITPANLAAMVGIAASPSSAWITGQHVVLGDTSHCYWSGTAWVAGNAPGGGFSAPAWGTVLGEYDFSNVGTIVSSGGLVSSVAVTSGTWPPVQEPASSAQPTTGTRTQNGLNVLDFDGNSDYLYLASINKNQPLTIAFALASDHVDGNAHGATGYWVELATNANVWKFRGNSADAVTTVPETTAFRVVVATYSGGNVNAWIDGIQVLSNAVVGPNGFGDFYFGSGIGDYWNGPIGHGIVYNGVVADPVGLSTALMTKWGVTAAYSVGGVTGIVGHYDPMNAASMTVISGTNVSQINDLCGHGYHLPNPSGASQPTLTTINGHTALSCDGYGKGIGRTTTPTPSTPMTVAWVGQDAGVPAFCRPWQGGAGAIIEYAGNLAGNPFVLAASATSIGLANQDGAPKTHISIFNGASSAIYKNNVSIATGDTGSGTMAGFFIGNDPTFTTGYHGAVGEVVIIDHALNATERTNLYNYLKAKWGTP